MDAEEYAKAREKLTNEKARLVDERASLEAQLSEIHNKISHLDEIIHHLSPLAGMPNSQGNLEGLGITDAIRSVLKQAGQREDNGRMTAGDIRRELSDNGFDFSGISQPMPSIYKVLGRLVEDYGEVDRERVDLEGSGPRVFYWWKEPQIHIDEETPF